MAEDYRQWTVGKLKIELSSRNASTAGRKADLIERLKAYDRNADFRSVPVILPEPLDPQWPKEGFQQITKEHKILLPKLCEEQVEGYFVYRMAEDRESSGDLKALEKGKLMLESKRILACSFNQHGEHIFFSGIVGAAMKQKVSYNFKIKISRLTGEPLNSHCECPAGKGPHGSCKHVAAVFLMLVHFIKTGDLAVEKSCTDNLQTFHKPKAVYSGSPVKAEDIPKKRKHLDSILEDPRPAKYRNLAGYNDFVRNSVINFCSTSSMDISLRYIYPKANLQVACGDHDYLKRPFLEYWVDKSLAVSEEKCKVTEQKTRQQSDSHEWFHERKWRLTASRFGDIIKMTHRRNKDKLCQSLFGKSRLSSRSLVHGRQFEPKAITKFEAVKGLKCKKAGLFVRSDYPFLGASPDGTVGIDSCIEVKCPYAGRNDVIRPGKLFPYLHINSDGHMVLREDSKYYAQVQGQLFIAKKRVCYFVIYTFVDFFVQAINVDEEYCQNSLVPKLSLFFEKYFRPYVASQL